MKQGMTNVDVAALATELRPLLVGARFDKAYQPGKDQVLLRVRRKGAGKLDLLFHLGRFLTVTRRPPANPDRPSMVAQILRTQFENGRVVAFGQVGFDRILRMDVERGDGRRSLVFELFGDGNLLVLDGDGTITLPMRGGDYAARSLRKGEPYVPPPGSALPFGMDVAALRAAGAHAKRDLVRMLAVDLGFGPLWAEEVCLRAGVAKSVVPAGMQDGDWAAVHGAIQRLGEEVRRNDLAPGVVHEGESAVDAVPFPLLKYPAPRFTFEETATFWEALDALFLGATGEEGDEEPDDPRRARFEDAKGKVEFQVRQISEAIAGFRAEEALRRADADALFASFADAQALLDGLRQARASRSWADVEAVLAERRKEGNALALRVPEVRGHEGKAVLRLRTSAGEERDVMVDLRENAQENGDALFEAAKRAKQRREGAESALKDAEARLREVEARGLDAFGAPPAKKVEAQSRHFWFEAYRWTVTPSGLIAVGGRNAAQNDAVVKKYLRDGDRYVHADIHGAPSVVLRPYDVPAGDVPDADLRAAGHFAVCASRAWRQFGHASAYWVTAAQVSKTPRSGEFVPRGAWIVHGKRTPLDGLATEWWVGKVPFTLSGQPVPRGASPVGRTVDKLVGGHRDSLARYADRLVRLVPGDVEPADAAARLAEAFSTSIEEAQGVLPAGAVRFEEAAA